MIQHEIDFGPAEFELGQGETAEIVPSGQEDTGFPQFGNYKTMAEITIGGDAHHGDPWQTLYLLNAPSQNDEDHKNLMARTGGAKAEFVLAAVEENGAILAMAPLPIEPIGGLGSTTKFIGRQGNVQWHKFGPLNSDTDVRWTPFERNYSVDGMQFDIKPDFRQVTITGISKKSSTLINAPAVRHKSASGEVLHITDEHEIVSRAIAEGRQKFSARIAKLLGRNRG